MMNTKLSWRDYIAKVWYSPSILTGLFAKTSYYAIMEVLLLVESISYFFIFQSIKGMIFWLRPTFEMKRAKCNFYVHMRIRDLIFWWLPVLRSLVFSFSGNLERKHLAEVNPSQSWLDLRKGKETMIYNNFITLMWFFRLQSCFRPQARSIPRNTLAIKTKTSCKDTNKNYDGRKTSV